jgi:hypothetical protein
MTTMLERTWIRRCLAALLCVEGAYFLGLTVLLGMIAPSAARFDGDEPNAIALALAGGIGIATSVVLVIAAVAVWRDAARTGGHVLGRAAVLGAAALHVMVAVGAVLGLLALAVGQSETGSVTSSAAGSAAATVAGSVIAAALVAAARPTRTSVVG